MRKVRYMQKKPFLVAYGRVLQFLGPFSVRLLFIRQCEPADGCGVLADVLH